MTRDRRRNLLTGLDDGPVNRQTLDSQRFVAESSRDVTALLQAWTGGDLAARDRLMSVVYRDLHRRAAAYLRRERAGHTLQPTALVHEAYMRLVDQHRVVWQNRGQFFGVAAQMMRRILVDRARARKMAKRSGQWARVTVDDAARATPPVNVDVLDLDAALVRLAEFDPRKCRLAELRFFGGLTLAEASDALGISPATAERDWQAARAWLSKELRPGRRHDT
jgi:RNA polymerase sigma-70 factor (ECF subfamily)